MAASGGPTGDGRERPESAQPAVQRLAPSGLPGVVELLAGSARPRLPPRHAVDGVCSARSRPLPGQDGVLVLPQCLLHGLHRLREGGAARPSTRSTDSPA